jgi:hypothetical protein
MSISLLTWLQSYGNEIKIANILRFTRLLMANEAPKNASKSKNVAHLLLNFNNMLYFCTR